MVRLALGGGTLVVGGVRIRVRRVQARQKYLLPVRGTIMIDQPQGICRVFIARRDVLILYDKLLV